MSSPSRSLPSVVLRSPSVPQIEALRHYSERYRDVYGSVSALSEISSAFSDIPSALSDISSALSEMFRDVSEHSIHLSGSPSSLSGLFGAVSGQVVDVSLN